MPRYINADGVVVDIPSELADRLDGYTPAEASPQEEEDLDPASVTAWLAAEDAYRADVTAWLDAETAAATAQHAAAQQSTAGRGRK